MLKRFWFVFKPSAESSVLEMGCGVTAYDRADAEKLLEEQAFPFYGARSIDKVVEDVDVSTLDDKHIRPNMGNPAARGVWFPLV